ncbi:hypothetical protein N7508_007752 [Penicillium antarcticum]|uniref:uncharacterized protein n=1 Tax=Penicillium antarcticum TaxID=416450 RepID=UPI0023864A8A|nr:uncharacterized protein N7508_007752 [Penicillium antarcticum]KAJ5297503.1 hypothetical protein N7508_007752 [Penicillium antarcticum]
MSEEMPNTGAEGTSATFASASDAEKSARFDTSGRNAAAPKPRSCVVCRSRKVRCDKRAPCSNCRRANIACVFPSSDRPPRWARRLDHFNGALSNPQASHEAGAIADEVMERLRTLESLVKDLTGQLEQAKSATGGSSGVGSPESSTHARESAQPPHISPAGAQDVQKTFGRLVLRNATQSRYISSGFWSRVNDEINGLKMDIHSLPLGVSDTSDDEESPGKAPSTQELEQTPSDRHAFLFGHNLNTFSPNITNLHPLPSQIPFLLDVFAENVNIILQIVHLPTIKAIVRDRRNREPKELTPANEALMFSIYYAAVTSMEEDDVMMNFGAPKTELNLKYRQGFEHALAKADFLNVPDLVLVQAFAIFIALVRRHDSPRFVWMMTGLAIRMGQALGLHRDGSNFAHLEPYEVEMRRRTWWVLCLLDVRASENQGSDYTITNASFDTKLPMNINDADIAPGSKKVPQEHYGLTDMSVARVTFGICQVTMQMMSHGFKDKAPSLDEQSRLLHQIYQTLEENFLQYSTDSVNITYWVIVIVARLTMAKMTLLIYLPLLFSAVEDELAGELRTKFLISAIEVAEYNHALNNEELCRHWRWAFQTYTHWYSIVYMMIEISRRPWSPISERAWVALHSVWLIPNQSQMNKSLRIWVPLRKLMSKARQHRDMEFERLKTDYLAAEQLKREYRDLPLPSSTGPFPPGSNSADLFLERWRQLASNTVNGIDKNPRLSSYSLPQTSSESIAAAQRADSSSGLTLEPDCLGSGTYYAEKAVPGTTSHGLTPDMLQDTNMGTEAEQHTVWAHSSFTLPEQVAAGAEQNINPWLWSDGHATSESGNFHADTVDMNIDIDGEVNWYNWVESAQEMGLDGEPGRR